VFPIIFFLKILSSFFDDFFDDVKFLLTKIDFYIKKSQSIQRGIEDEGVRDLAPFFVHNL
jgi:hypothetical protein